MINFVGVLNGAKPIGEGLKGQFSKERISFFQIEASSPSVLDKFVWSFKIDPAQGETIHLADSIPMGLLAEKADFEGGAAFGRLEIDAAEKAVPAAFASKIVTRSCFPVDHGQINLGGDDEAECNATLVAALLAGEWIKISTIDLGPREESMKQYEFDEDGEVKGDACESMFAAALSPDADDRKIWDLVDGEVTVALKIGDESFGYDLGRAVGLTASVGQYEGQGPRRIAVLLSDKLGHRPGAAYKAKLNGSKAGEYGILTVTPIAHQARVAEKAVETMAEITAHAESVEKKNPALARALVMQRKLVPAADLRKKTDALTKLARIAKS